MTETQAQSGPSEAAAPGANEPLWPGGGPDPGVAPSSGAGTGTATGRASVVGRATVPDGGNSDDGSSAAPAPKYTRAPGMPPPPDVLVPVQPAAEGAAFVSTPISAVPG